VEKGGEGIAFKMVGDRAIVPNVTPLGRGEGGRVSLPIKEKDSGAEAF